MKDRLLTGERLLKWGYKCEVQCCFYHNQLETRDHIYFFNAVLVLEYENISWLDAYWIGLQ
jgi:hypothetical protein